MAIPEFVFSDVVLHPPSPNCKCHLQTNGWRSTGKRRGCCTTTTTSIDVDTCNIRNTKLRQLPDALSGEERDMAYKLVQLGQSHLMVFDFVGIVRLYRLDFPAACDRYI